MTFFHAIENGFRTYAEFLGRASRPEFWWWILFTALVSGALNAIPALTIRLPDGGLIVGPSIGTTLSAIWGIAVLLPTLALIVRRLRDAGFGWGHVFWLLLPVAGLVVLAVLCAQPSKLYAPQPHTPSAQPAPPAAPASQP
jgi:uncharacterized membrane protein YhaH (DUF805 family)